MKPYADPSRGPGRRAFALACVALAMTPAAGLACGACVEDLVAAAYDHAAVQRAAARGAVMVYCAVAGPIDARRLIAAARGVRGIEPDSVRVATQPPALSFAVDPKIQSPQAAVEAAQRSAAPGTRLSIVRLLMPAVRPSSVRWRTDAPPPPA